MKASQMIEKDGIDLSFSLWVGAANQHTLLMQVTVTNITLRYRT